MSHSGNRRNRRTAPVRRESAVLPRTPWCFAVWRDHHLHSALSSFGRIVARPWAGLLTVLVMGFALALPLLFGLALDNLRELGGGWQESHEISVFLKPGSDGQAGAALADKLAARADVVAVRRKTPAEGLDELRRLSGFAEALDILKDNPLPEVLIVAPREAGGERDPAVLAALAAEPGVDLVQYDAAWRRRLAAILGLAARAVQVLGILLAAAALLVIGNAVRSDIQARHEEIAVMQLLGASPGFVRRPFLYAGLWYGLASGLIAVLLVLGVEGALAEPVTRLVASYAQRFAIDGLSVGHALGAILISGVLGWLGALLAASRHMAAGQPE